MSGYREPNADVTDWSADVFGITEATVPVHGSEPSSAPRSGSTRTRLRHRRRRLSAELRGLPVDAPRRAVLVDELARLAALERLLPKDTTR